jgi:hypothetical protein
LQVWVKEEGSNPTGSFKARGLSLAVNRARELGLGKAQPVQSATASHVAAEAHDRQHDHRDDEEYQAGEARLVAVTATTAPMQRTRLCSDGGACPDRRLDLRRRLSAEMISPERALSK